MTVFNYVGIRALINEQLSLGLATASSAEAAYVNVAYVSSNVLTQHADDDVMNDAYRSTHCFLNYCALLR